MSDYSYPTELIKKVEHRIRTQLDGNTDIPPKDVVLNILRAGVGIFSARTEFDLDCKVTISQEKGKRSQGTIVSAGQLDTEINAHMATLHNGDGFAKIAEAKVKSLPLNGFGAEKITVDLPSEKITLTEQFPCTTCQGKGRATCAQCQGRGRQQCPRCHATGLINCHYCHGRGQVQHGEQIRPCTTCQGRGQIYCTQCQGQKQIPCGGCQTSGQISCGGCGGAGTNSKHAAIMPHIKPHAVMNIQNLDDEPKRMAAKIGGLKLVQGGHATLNVNNPMPLGAEESDVPPSNSTFDNTPPHALPPAVHYTVTMPWAVGEITLNDTDYTLGLCGHKGAVAESKKFMDDILHPSYQLFKKAASGQGYIAGLLQDASAQSRVSRETLASLIQTNPKKTMLAVSKSYPIGLSKDFIKGFVHYGYSAIKHMTRRVRYAAMGVGILLAAVTNYAWFIDGLRNTGVNFLSSASQFYPAIDAIPLIVSIIAVVICIKVAAAIVTRKFMRALNIKGFRSPPMGKAGLYGCIGVICIWVAFMVMHYMPSLLL